MPDLLMNEIVGQRDAYRILDWAYEKQNVIKSTDLNQLIWESNLSQDVFSNLTSAGLFIGTPDGFSISSLGEKVTLLLRAINGKEEISETIRQLTYLYPDIKPYELVTENITDYFIDSLYVKPDFIRVYICSPWIRLDEHHIEKVKSAISKASERYLNLQIFVVTLPLERYRDKKATETLDVLKCLGAEVVTHGRLHAKLYMSEPGPLGGSHYAIFGSENLTGRRNIELAIKIQNDNEILRKLNQYFYEIWQDSQILEEV